MNKPLLSIFETNQLVASLVLKILVTLLVACAAVSFMGFGSRINPTWNGSYFPLLAWFISIETLAARKKSSDLDTFQKLAFHFAEWVIFAVLLKGTIYLLNSPNQLWLDLPRWQADFLTFFDGEFILIFICLLFFWRFSQQMGEDIENMQTRLTDLNWEMGKLENDRQKIRVQSAQKILVMGSLVVVATLLTRLNLPQYIKQSPAAQVSIAPVGIFFSLALVFLSLTQFFLLKGRWFWNKTPISPDMGKNWIRYTVIFLLIITLAALILPTTYSSGLLQTLQVAVSLLGSIAYFLVSTIFVAFAWFLSLFGLRTTNADDPAVPIQIPEITPPLAASSPLQWLELAKSIFFWVVFIGTIVFAFRYYFSQNSGLFQSVRMLPIPAAVKKWIFWILTLFAGFTRRLASVITKNARRIRFFQSSAIGVLSGRKFLDFRRLSPRQQVLYYYSKILENSAQSGWKRLPFQTPSQFEEKLAKGIPEASDEVSGITSQFIEARYSQHPISKQQTSLTQSFWRKIIRSLRNKKPNPPPDP